MPMTKAQWRARLLAARRDRSAVELAGARSAVAAAVLAHADVQGWTCVAAYEPLPTEPGSTDLLAQLVVRGVRVLVPLTLPDRDLDWKQWDGRPSREADDRLGLDAVGAAQAVLVPALAVAVDGTRLGRGGGSYDRALTRCGPHAEVIALLFDGELVDALPREPWDRPVGAVITPVGRQPVGRNTGVAGNC
jgi:5-formyltetrahydrofolate cyclo-ligase